MTVANTIAGMIHKLDESVGQLVTALNEAGMLENSLIIFSSDNGGATHGYDRSAGSNWPLKAVSRSIIIKHMTSSPRYKHQHETDMHNFSGFCSRRVN